MTATTESEVARARRERGAEGVRELLEAVFARCETATEACDALGMVRLTLRSGRAVAPISTLRKAADRAGVAWPYTTRGRPVRR